jgi:predicted nuclease of restriction endonuclease-like (RecB) superfamily
LQQELPGLRGFSAGNIKKMRIFYEKWCECLENRALLTHDLKKMVNQNIEIRTLSTDDLKKVPSGFLNIGFTHHYEILNKIASHEERLFYIEQCATEFWNVETLRYNLKSKLYSKQGKLSNNFKTTISDKDLQRKALLSFKDEYLLDFVNIEDPDDEPDERVLESGIVGNIRKFIMSLGKDFSFIGNQYRLAVEEQEYFIDLLFFNRQLQALIAIELKSGAFKPEYLGKMNFYLSALDDLVRLPHENPSIGIILCKSQKQRVVEYAFRDTTKPMGVATYKTATKLPPKYRNVLPDAERLKELL